MHRLGISQTRLMWLIRSATLQPTESLTSSGPRQNHPSLAPTKNQGHLTDTTRGNIAGLFSFVVFTGCIIIQAQTFPSIPEKLPFILYYCLLKPTAGLIEVCGLYCTYLKIKKVPLWLLKWVNRKPSPSPLPRLCIFLSRCKVHFLSCLYVGFMNMFTSARHAMGNITMASLCADFPLGNSTGVIYLMVDAVLPALNQSAPPPTDQVSACSVVQGWGKGIMGWGGV